MELPISDLAMGIHALLLLMEGSLVVGPCVPEESEKSQGLVYRDLGFSEEKKGKSMHLNLIQSPALYTRETEQVKGLVYRRLGL